MQKKDKSPSRVIARIHARIVAMDWVCSGTLQKRTQTCGKPNCHCAKDPSVRHGPYYAWGRMENGRLRSTAVSSSQVKQLAMAIKNHKAIVALLRLWTRETARKQGILK